eukprot:TRINITY_DN31476_c0_g1_i1.p1 TRINITY_DN31476_c0_g1~~TRINITY_DN31476_c0_g1_i1.p1  ORF type:complete len:608 (-),score=86.35 TRINITY_DN31476_c0_g1_i1:489-2312(-)
MHHARPTMMQQRLRVLRRCSLASRPQLGIRRCSNASIFSGKSFRELPLQGLPGDGEEVVLDRRLLRGIEDLVGREAQLTNVQALALPTLLSDRRPDLLLKAPTGTGKTLAFLVPAAQRLLDRSVRKAGIKVLVLAPSRELVLQLAKVSRTLLQDCALGAEGVRSSFVAGGFSLQEDIERLQVDSPDVLIGTPGRLVQHLQGTPNFIRALASVEFVVLDEADRLLDDTFVRQVDYVVRCLPSSPRPQSLLCSATFSEAVRRFAQRSLRADFQALDVSISTSSVVSPSECSLAKSDSVYQEVVSNVEQEVIRYQPKEFFAVLARLIKSETEAPEDGDSADKAQKRRMLVLFPTVRWLQFTYVLFKHRGGFRNLWALHRQLPDDKRRARAAIFSRGAPEIRGCLFASDLAARGIDFDVDVVVQIGPPVDREQYVHRAGRTGRVGARGKCFLMINSVEEQAIMSLLKGLPLSEPGEANCPASRDESLEIPQRLEEWWEEPSLVASADLCFASVLGFYFERRRLLQATVEQIVRLAADLLASSGLPRERALPPVNVGLAKQLLAEDALCGIKAASIRQRWDLHSALPAYPGFRSRSHAKPSSGDASGVEGKT